MTDNQQQPGVTINQLAYLVNGINVAQKRGAYNLEESAALLAPVRAVVEFVNAAKKQQEENEAPATEAPAPEEAASETGNTTPQPKTI